jgi:hypothetical protein
MTKLRLNDYQAAKYRRALQHAGFAIPANADKVALYRMVIEREIDMTSWRYRPTPNLGRV